MSLALYQIAAEHRAMVDALMEHNDDAQSIADTIEAESWPLEQKAQNVAYAIRNLEASAASIKDAEKQMADRRKAIEKRADHVREYLKTCMEVAGVTKIECPHFALTIRKNPASVDIFEPGIIPAQYMRQLEPPPPSPDKKVIKDDIAAGIDVPGAMMVHGTRLEIK